MKNFLLTIAFSAIFIFNAFSNNEPFPNNSKFSIEAISFEIDAQVKEAYGMDIVYTKDTNTLFLTSETEVNFVQVLNGEGTLEYQLPLFSKEIIIDLDDFTAGDYQLNLIVKDNEIISSVFTK